MLRIAASIIQKHLKGWFLVHFLVNFFANFFCVPLLTRITNDNIIRHEIHRGIGMLIGFILLNICINYHKSYCLDPHKFRFHVKANKELEDWIQSKFIRLNWNKIRSLKKEEEFVRLKENVKYSLMYFIDFLVQQVICLFPFFGYVSFLVSVSPYSVALYIIGIGAMIYYNNQSPPKGWRADYNSWDHYMFLQSNQFTDIIHNRGIDNKNRMVDHQAKIEEIRTGDRTERAVYVQHLKTVFDLIFAMNLGLFISTMTDSSQILTYIQYTSMVKYDITIFGDIYKQYHETKCDYEKLVRILLGCPDREIVPQAKGFETILIKNLAYTYPKKDDNQNPFTVTIETPIKMEAGQIIRLAANSGNGKSTFMDIVCAIIPYHEMTHEIYFDGIRGKYGFDAISTMRLYVEQMESIDWKSSAYEIIAGIYIGSDDAVPQAEEDLVWKAIEMASGTDFLKRCNDKNELKWIYTKNITPSGGQLGRIRIARLIYKMLKEKPKIVVLDEVDTAFQGEMGIEIMGNIFAHCRANKILCLVSAHTTEVKQLHYDACIQFKDGKCRF